MVLWQYTDGEVAFPKDSPIKDMCIVLSGRTAAIVDGRDGSRQVFEWRAGDVLGLLQYSRMAAPPYDAIAQQLDYSCFAETGFRRFDSIKARRMARMKAFARP
jgi:CRP-like cAMP-binding protein